MALVSGFSDISSEVTSSKERGFESLRHQDPILLFEFFEDEVLSLSHVGWGLIKGSIKASGSWPMGGSSRLRLNEVYTTLTQSWASVEIVVH